VSVAIPLKKLSPDVRMLSLSGFAPVLIGAMWRGRTTPLLQMFLDEAQLRAKRLKGGGV
jgi:hypothetical protein